VFVRPSFQPNDFDDNQNPPTIIMSLHSAVIQRIQHVLELKQNSKKSFMHFIIIADKFIDA